MKDKFCASNVRVGDRFVTGITGKWELTVDMVHESLVKAHWSKYPTGALEEFPRMGDVFPVSYEYLNREFEKVK